MGEWRGEGRAFQNRKRVDEEADNVEVPSATHLRTSEAELATPIGKPGIPTSTVL